MNKCVINQPSQMTSVGAAIRELLQIGAVKIQFDLHKQTRSEAQNKLLWMWHGEFQKHIEEHQGKNFSTDEIHEYVAEKLLPKNAVTINGEPIIIRTRTSKLNTKSFTDFLERYQAWVMNNYQLRFTHPDDLYWQAMGVQQ